MAITLIQTVTVGSGGAASIDFTSIAATYTDLMMVLSLRSTSSAGPAASANITFNGTSSGYSERLVYNNTSGGAASGSRSGNFLDWSGLINAGLSTVNTFSNNQFYVPNYTSANNKVTSAEAIQEDQSGNSSYWNHYITAGLWSNTAAINRITLTSSAGNLAQYSSATLYGITKGSSGGVTVS
jgi:hypothetical protein